MFKQYSKFALVVLVVALGACAKSSNDSQGTSGGSKDSNGPLPFQLSTACVNGGGYLPKNTMNIGVRAPAGSKDFLPPNTMSIAPGAERGGVNEGDFNQVIDKADAFYSPIVSQHGGNLEIRKLWSDGTVNAFATRSGNQWIVNIYGGLARHSAMTKDGLALIVCHELGHHLGGSPKYRGQWAANEGQSDYFANMKCLRKIWANESNAQIVSQMSVPSKVRKECEKSFSDSNEIAICERAAIAGFSAAGVSASLDGTPSIDYTTPDTSEVWDTVDTHPLAQCRLDTYFSGSICQVSKDVDFDENNPVVGSCAEEKGDRFGFRPKCWYKPSSVSDPTPTPTFTPTPTPTSTSTPTPTPTPTEPTPSGITPAPFLNGQASLVLNNPNQSVAIQYNVSGIRGAAGVYVEIVGPNRNFMTQNGTTQDPTRIFAASNGGAQGQFLIIPAISLPTWGVYQIRVIALDSSGHQAVAEFSNPVQLILQR